uniref:Uncharacterized protein n=1 Tax=Rhizophora mucronata TaxID=61149 RepID=A0A2P2P866_RHIMU
MPYYAVKLDELATWNEPKCPSLASNIIHTSHTHRHTHMHTHFQSCQLLDPK